MTYTIDQIAAAFDRLIDHAGRTCDAATAWAIAGAKDDVLAILAGDWRGDEEQPAEVADDFAALFAVQYADDDAGQEWLL